MDMHDDMQTGSYFRFTGAGFPGLDIVVIHNDIMPN